MLIYYYYVHYNDSNVALSKLFDLRMKLYMSVAMLEIGGPCDWSIRAKIVTVSRFVARIFPFSQAFSVCRLFVLDLML